MKIKLRIPSKIMIISCFVASIPLAGFFYQMSLSNKEIKQSVESGLQNRLDIIAHEIEHWADNNIRNATFAARLDPIKHMANSGQTQILKAAKENLDWVSLIFTMDPNGNAVARSDNKPLKNYSDREYVKQVLAGQEIGQQVLIGKVKPVPLHCFALPIEQQVNQLAGIITQCATLETISEYIANFKIGDSGYAILVDNKNRLIATGGDRNRVVGQLQDFSSHPALELSSDGEVSILSYEGNKQAMLTKSLNYGWRLIVQQDFAEAYSGYNTAQKNSFIISIPTMCFTLAVSLFSSLSIARPIKNLTQAADNISKGNLLEYIPGEDRYDELGDLARAFSRMTSSVSLAIRRYRKVRDKQKK
jgi:methyl-accepting chemotaxis protein